MQRKLIPQFAAPEKGCLKVLTESLRQLAADGLVLRRDFRQVPPRVEYELTELGQKMETVLDSLADFGRYYQSLS